MRPDDSVFCVCCGQDFAIGLLQLVRWEGPLWCQSCIAKADHALVEAQRRVERAQEGLVDRG